MRNHQANVLISGSGIGQLCEKYLSKPCFSYVHLTSSTNSSGLLPVPQALAACLKCYKTHGGCSPGWLFLGVLKSWIPHPPLLFLTVHVLGTLLLHVPCLPGVHQLHGPAASGHFKSSSRLWGACYSNRIRVEEFSQQN